MAKSKTNGTVYAVECNLSAWNKEWKLLTAIRPSTDKAAVLAALEKYIGTRRSAWRTGPYRISAFKRTKSELIDAKKIIAKRGS